MTGSLGKVICVRALADDLRFLKPVTNRMAKLLGSKLRVCELNDHSSHVVAMIALKSETYDFAVFFAHGGRDYLRGGEFQIRATGENIETERFLSRDELGILKGKVVFCMSCDSNGLAETAINSGTRAFVGFDKVPFNRFDENGDSIGSHVLVKHCQDILADSVKLALEQFFSGKASLDEAVEFLRIILVNRAIEYVRKNVAVKERREVAALLLQTKTGLRYHGQKGVQFAK